MLKSWMRGAAATGLGLTLMAGGASAQQNDAQGAGDLPGPIDSLQDLQDTGKMVFKLADMNNDNQISQKEAIDAGNLLVGGFFFRADANGDGTLSQDEARQAREALMQQKPFLRLVLQRAKDSNAGGQPNATQTPVQGIGALLDGNNDRQLQASELRQAVQTTVGGLYQAADTNRDGQMSPSEINAAILGAARAAAQAAFQAADNDHNNQLSRQEFDKAIVEPANALFGIVDANGDGQLSQQEAQAAQKMVASQLRMLQVPEPANSAANMIESGRTPNQTGQAIPDFGGNNAAQPRQPSRTTPAQGQPQPRTP